MPDSPAHFVSSTDVNTAYLNALDNPRSDGGIFNIAGPADCRTTFGAIKAEMAAATGGAGTAEEHWGSNPYPQFYYDTTAAEDVLDFMHTSKAGLLDNMAAAVGEIDEFLRYYRP
jgi:nucleoside-diphosphate-sugar epimerase